jgi:glycosyltransferase involved in cell wall biosynthesis
LLSQTFADFELVISDNGSTDATEDICLEYAARDGRIRYCREETNRGAIWNFNRVFELSRGEYFKWAAYDDLCHASFLERCAEVLDRQADVNWCHSLTHHMDADGSVISAKDDPTIPADEPAHSLLLTNDGLPRHTRASAETHHRFEGVLLGTTWCSDSYGLIRSAALRKTRLLLPCYGAEKILIGELSLQGRFAEIPEVLFLERVHGEASGALLSANDQRRFVNPSGTRKFSSTRLQLLQGHLGAILHAPLSRAERLRCFGVLLRYLLQIRKWKKVFLQTCAGIGIGAETRTEHEMAGSNVAAKTTGAIGTKVASR